MKVRCRLCKHEKSGYCQKKTRDSWPVKIRTNKPRSCSLYEEDPLKVLGEYRKSEAHKKKLVNQQLVDLKVAELASQMQAANARNLVEQMAKLQRDSKDSDDNQV